MRNLTEKGMAWSISLLMAFSLLIAISLTVAFNPAGIALADDDAQSKQLYLPAVVNGRATAKSCEISNTRYSSLSVEDPMDVNADKDPDLNLGHRGYKEVDAPLRLVTYPSNGPDTKAPQFPALFADKRVPSFTNTYQRYRWDNGPTDTYSPWPTTVLGMGVNPGETIYTPDSGYDIGGGYEYMVMYAAETRITLHIGREDDFAGYVVHIEDVCIDSDLLALYRKEDAQERGELPVLRGHQPFGKALGKEIKIAVRDTGSFMDPRSRNDWWQGR